MDFSHSMLKVANLPPAFWEEAITTIYYIQKHIFSKRIQGISYTFWFGKTPNYFKLRVFGSIIYAFIPPDNQNKL